MLVQTTSLDSFFKGKIKLWTVVSFLIATVCSFFIFTWISKLESEKRVLEIAQTTAAAFRSTILSGDIQGVELQSRDAFSLADDEEIIILDSRREPMLMGRAWPAERICIQSNESCWHYLPQFVSAVVPIYFDSDDKNVFGYVFTSIHGHINWPYILSVTLALFCALFIMALGLVGSMSSALSSVTSELSSWAEKLRTNPKQMNLDSKAPFSELNPIHNSLANLKKEISHLEKMARTEGKLMVLRGIAHDILTPVSQLKKMLGVLEIQNKSDKQASSQTIEKLGQYLRKLETIASQVLVLRDGNYKSETPISFESVGVIREIITQLREDDLLMQKEIKLLLVGEIKSRLNISRIDLERILVNLIRNAAYASDEGSEIIVFLSESSGGVLISVKDFGVGIPAENQEKIFEVDFSTRPSVGTGLGLPIVKTICERNQAQISFSSQAGKGTEFKILFPGLSGGKSEIQNISC